MNTLYLHTVRRRAAGALHSHNIPRGSWDRAPVVVAATPLHRTAPMRAQWQRNTAIGALECRWVSDAPITPQPTRNKARFAASVPMHRPLRGAGLRPPLRHRVRG